MSNYNIVFDSDSKSNSLWLFNTISGSMVNIKQEIYDLLKKNKIDEVKADYNDVFVNLKKNGIIQDKNLNEINLLKYMYWKTKFSQDNLNLSITLTKDCNFDCKYCYEKKENISLSDDVVKRIIKFVDSKSNTINSLSIGWFGGEPMLKMDLIENLSVNLMNICRNKNISYSSYITTNGYFLNLKNFEKLLSFNVNNIQVTVDGAKKYHDKLRPLKGGGGTYDRIISNLLEIRSKYSRENLPKGFLFDLRVNISEMNKSGIDEWLKSEFPKELKDLVNIYFAKIFLDGEQGSAASINSLDKNLFPEKRRASFDTIEMQKKANEPSFNMSRDLRTTFIYCGAEYYNSYTILVDGGIGKCGVTMDKFGELSKNGDIVITEKGDYIDWMTKDPFTFKGIFKECEKCKLLPLCMGGCGRIIKRFGKKGCYPYKNEMEKYLKMVRDSLLEKQN